MSPLFSVETHVLGQTIAAFLYAVVGLVIGAGVHLSVIEDREATTFARYVTPTLLGLLWLPILGVVALLIALSMLGALFEELIGS